MIRFNERRYDEIIHRVEFRDLVCRECGRVIRYCPSCGGRLVSSTTVFVMGEPENAAAYYEHPLCHSRLYCCPGCGKSVNAGL